MQRKLVILNLLPPRHDMGVQLLLGNLLLDDVYNQIFTELIEF
jgi:hypothetical protein